MKTKPRTNKTILIRPLAGAQGLLPADYPHLLKDIKDRIRAAQVKATFSANREMILMYWDIGRMIAARQKMEGWGAAVIPRLARDIRNDLPEEKGFSERNLKRMAAFFREYSTLLPIGPRPVAQLKDSEPKGPLPVALLAAKRDAILPQPAAELDHTEKVQRLVVQLPWAHNVLLMQKIKHLPTRCWYMMAAIQEGWSRDVLCLMIDSRAHERQGKAVTNFEARLPAPQSDLARQVLKDPYIFDFLTLEEPFREREMETGLTRHLEKFLLELGQGFAFIGRQVHIDVGEEDFYIDLLFYHLKLRAFIVIDLKKGPFKPEYAGKMNFYCSVVDDRMRHASDNPTIGVSEYQLTRALPREFKSVLPSIDEIEAELSR